MNHTLSNNKVHSQCLMEINKLKTKCLVSLAVLILSSACSDNSSDDELSNESYVINTSVNMGGTITPEQLVITTGSSANFTLHSETGFHLKEVSGCSGSLTGNEYRTGLVDADCLISVTFAQNTYTVSTDVAEGGKVTPAISYIDHGDSVDLTLTANTDHKIGQVSGCEGQLIDYVYVTGEVNQDCTVNVNFSPVLPLPEAPLTRVRLPIVVHIMDNEYVQLSNEKIISQIAATNKHFRQQNLSELDTIAAEHKAYIADTGIQFYLADEDPDGNPHNGIIRVNSTISVFNSEYDFAKTELGGSEPWPNDQYINVWLSYAKDRFGRVGIAGRAHIPTMVPDEYIGVSIAQSLFGTVGADVPGYDQGKTLTHELAHFLGLIGHVNGNYEGNSNHATLPCSDDSTTNCQNFDLQNNFMRVGTNDHGVKMFSKSQRDLMRDWLETGPLQALYLNNLP